MTSVVWSSITFRVSLFITIVVLAVLTTTWLLTTLNYHRRISQTRPSKGKNKKPATIPYAVPWLGSALGFLNDQGNFYDSIRSKVGTATSICSVQLGPVKSYIVMSATAVEAVFQNSRYLSTDRFVRMIEQHGFGMPVEDVNQINRTVPKQPGIHGNVRGKLLFSQQPGFQRYLLDQSAVNELTSKFIEVFRDALGADMSKTTGGKWVTTDLYSWLKDHMFVASTTALMGSHILNVYPDVGRDFWLFDGDFLKIVYGTPQFMAPKVYAALKRLQAGTERWLNDARVKQDGNVESTMDPDWEPYLGSRLVRARQRLFANAKLSMKARASLEIGLLFGISSNAIPSTGWMLFHILSSPHDLLPRVLSEIVTAQTATDSTLDIPKLIALPLLHSIYTETLRLYVAVNVTREIHADFVVDGYLLKQGATIMAPTWLGHRDPEVWNKLHADHPPVDEFYAERFLRQEDEKTVFSTSGLKGKYFPYGGGAHICPGRFFAKQEILAAVAMVLLGYEFEFVRWANPNGKDREERFPRTKKGYVGNGVMAADRDMRVRMRRKS